MVSISFKEMEENEEISTQVFILANLAQASVDQKPLGLQINLNGSSG